MVIIQLLLVITLIEANISMKSDSSLNKTLDYAQLTVDDFGS